MKMGKLWRKKVVFEGKPFMKLFKGKKKVQFEGIGEYNKYIVDCPLTISSWRGETEVQRAHCTGKSESPILSGLLVSLGGNPYPKT